MRLVQKALTFDDVLLVPAHSKVLPRDVSLKTRLTRNIQLNIPLVSAAMDTVTESRLAIAIAQEGGVGIVHKNLPPKKQAAEVAKVKRYESGVLRDPVTVAPDITVRELLALTQQYKVSGFPVVEKGKVVGMVTNRDYRFETKLDQPVRAIMTPRERLIYVKEGASPEEARALLHKHRLERVLVVRDGFELRGLITVKDILKSSEHPEACKDQHGKLRVGAAVGVGEGTKAVAAGAHTVMLGSLFAGTEESPGEIELFQGRSYKSYRGMGSLAAMKEGAADRYFQDSSVHSDKLVPEGVEGRVPYKGPGVRVIEQ